MRSHHNASEFVSLGSASRWVLEGLVLKIRPSSAPTLPGITPEKRPEQREPLWQVGRMETLGSRASGRMPKLVCARNMRE
jgi:hypothetical protein